MSPPAEKHVGTVLHLIDTDGPGGAETVFVSLARGLAERGWRSVTAVTEEGWSSAELERRDIEPHLVPVSGGWDLRHFRGLWRLIERENVDLVQAHLLGPALYGAAAARLRGVPAVATFHGSWDLRNPGALPGLKRRGLEACLDAAVFVSSPLRREVEREMSSWSVRAEVIPNGIETSRFQEMSRDGFRDELGVSGDEFLVGTVGNVRPAKSHESFLRLASRLQRLDDSYRFVMVGDVSEEALRDLRALQSELGLEEHLVITGYRDDVENVLAGLDVFVLTSSSEGFSLTTVEAMASGLPVVATRCGGPEEIIEAGRTGLLVEVGDTDDMARQVERLRTSPDFCRKLGAAARRQVDREYSRSRMIDGYEDLYRDVLRAGGGA